MYLQANLQQQQGRNAASAKRCQVFKALLYSSVNHR